MPKKSIYMYHLTQKKIITIIASYLVKKSLTFFINFFFFFNFFRIGKTNRYTNVYALRLNYTAFVCAASLKHCLFTLWPLKDAKKRICRHRAANAHRRCQQSAAQLKQQQKHFLL